MPVLHTALSELQHVSVRGDYLLLEALDVDSLFDIFSDVEVDGRWLKQVHDLLVVDLQVAALDKIVELRAVCVFLY